MSENMTVCPECGTEFDTVAQEKELPVQALQQECSSCGYEIGVAIINYPNSTYEVIAPALKGDVCTATISPEDGGLGTTDCGGNAMIRRHKIGEPQGGRCAEHIGAHHEEALGLRSEL